MTDTLQRLLHCLTPTQLATYRDYRLWKRAMDRAFATNAAERARVERAAVRDIALIDAWLTEGRAA